IDHAIMDPASAARELQSAVQGSAADDTGPATARAELSVIVAMMSGNPVANASPRADDEPRRTAARTVPITTRLPAGPLSPANWRPPGRRRRSRWLIVAAALIALAAVALVLARGPARSFADRLMHRHPATAATHSAHVAQAAVGPVATKHPAATHRRAALAVGTLAPPSAGPVQGVVVRPVSPCRTGSPCALTVTIPVAHSPDAQQLTWRFAVLDRCTGVRSYLPGGSMIAQPNWTYVYDTRTVRLPAARSLAVVGLTTAPVQVASQPVFVGSGTC
ncbi:MAG: hypothetical protein JWO57_3219, partial [Pseudonocardiales bacterium]|nr:hypothetical protein [Pseudonocardiales bacterium]